MCLEIFIFERNPLLILQFCSSMCTTILHPNDPTTSTKVIDETQAANVTKTGQLTGPGLRRASEGSEELLFDLSRVKKAGNFLEDCRIFLSGFGGTLSLKSLSGLSSVCYKTTQTTGGVGRAWASPFTSKLGTFLLWPLALQGAALRLSSLIVVRGTI